MTQKYATHDITLKNQLVFNIPDVSTIGNAGAGAGAGAGDAAKKRELFSVPVQFPPKILSDNRKGKWRVGDLRGVEPEAVFETSGPREFALLLTYIVDGGQWTTKAISDVTHQLRGYFANVRNGADQRDLVVYFKYIGFGGKQVSARIQGIDVKHGDTLILNPGAQSDIDSSFPLRTDVTIDMRLWVNTENQQIDGLDAGPLPVAWH